MEEVDNFGPGLPTETYLRARLLVDLSPPLIPGLYLPLGDGQVMWVYFRFEGVFKFCKKCGNVGHYAGSCLLSAYDAHHILHRRFQALEDGGWEFLHCLGDILFIHQHR